MTILQELDAGIVADALRAVRERAALQQWEGMFDQMAERLPTVCRQAAEAAVWGRARLALAQRGTAR